MSGLSHANDGARELLDVLVAESRDYAIFTLDPAGRVASWNAGAQRFKGYAAEEILGRHFSVFYSPEDIAAGKPARELEIAAAEGRVEDEGWRIRQDGSRFWADVVITALRGDDGALRGFGKVTRDLTERREREEAVRRAERQFRTTIDHAPIGIALVAPDGRWLRVNRALCDMTGYAEGQLLASTFQNITHPDDRDADVDHLQRLLAGDITSYEMEKRCFRADGSTIWVLLSVSLVRDDEAEPLHFVTQIQDITARKRFESDLRNLADHDPLTGLANRRALSLQMGRELAHQERYGESVGFVMIDLDHFKYINDSLGHRVGDQIIRAVADVLTERMRKTDTVARLGGDEFGILIPRANHLTIELIASELVELIAGVKIDAGDREISCSASIGTVLSTRPGEYDEDALIAAADLAMYDAKDAGRGRFAIYDKAGGGEVRASARLDWSERIRNALKDDGFVLHYQPIVDLRDGSDGRYEALIRLPGADGELVMPGAFLYIAERYGLMPAIDRWVVDKVITSLADGTLPAGAVIALNISARSLTDTTLLAFIKELLIEHRVPAAQLIFEVTESAAITQLEIAKRFGRGLQRLGCGFALDDFGTGFGSFFHLKHLPYGYIKIDGEFIHGMRRSASDRLLVQALVSVARGMDKLTVAEFVGDAETVALLRELGVDYGQGYHLGKPVAIDRRRDVRS